MRDGQPIGGAAGMNASALWRNGWRAGGPRLVIGLLNNMGDGALAATERQFAGLLREAAGMQHVSLRLFTFTETPRGEAGQAYLAGRYADAALIADADLDGLIVTGAEPRAAALDAEAYWPAMTRVVDWGESAGVATIWSCLAAHAAVLRLDGVRRRPLPAKLSGVFTSETIWHDPLLEGAPAPRLAPHSRLNTLSEEDLVLHGYRILSRSAEAGVDAFVRRGRATQLFLQGHPEYDADTLMREYVRDMGRFARGERPERPAIPTGYFDEATELALTCLDRRAGRHKASDPIAALSDVLGRAQPEQSWRDSAVSLYRNWLAEIAERKWGETPAVVDWGSEAVA